VIVIQVSRLGLHLRSLSPLYPSHLLLSHK
jgi:hypothetical protein